MEEKLISEAAQQGIWAMLFIFLFIYQLRESRRREDESKSREEKLQNFINDMAKNFETLGKQYERLAGDVEEIKISIARK